MYRWSIVEFALFATSTHRWALGLLAHALVCCAKSACGLAALRVVNIIFFMSALHNQRLKPSTTMFFALVLRNLSKKSIFKGDFCISA
jgi:hypothetical protein